MTVTAGEAREVIDIPSPVGAEGVAAVELDGPTCTGARARSRAYPIRWGRGALRLITMTAGDYWPVWEATPTPVGEVREWAKAGGWTGRDIRVLRGIYVAYTALVAVPVSTVAYWVIGALMQVSALDEPDDPKGAGWVPVTPPPVGELWSRMCFDVEATEGRRWVVAVGEGSVVVVSGLLLAWAWLSQRLGRVVTVLAVVGTVALCQWR
jgi:hypothetical protein